MQTDWGRHICFKIPYLFAQLRRSLGQAGPAFLLTWLCWSQQCFISRQLGTWSLMAVSQVKSLCNLGIKQPSALLRGCYVYSSVKMTNVSGFPVPAQSTAVFCWIFNVAYYLSKGQMFFLEIHVYCRYNTLNYDLYASSPKDRAKFNTVLSEPKGIFFLCQKRGFPFPTCTFLLVDFQ